MTAKYTNPIPNSTKLSLRFTSDVYFENDFVFKGFDMLLEFGINIDSSFTENGDFGYLTGFGSGYATHRPYDPFLVVEKISIDTVYSSRLKKHIIPSARMIKRFEEIINNNESYMKSISEKYEKYLSEP